MECFIISENGVDFLSNVESWRDNLKPYGEITFYSSRTEARMELEFIDLAKLGFDEIKDGLSVYQFTLDEN